MDQSKFVINDTPDNIKNILNEIYECIRDDRVYEESNKQTVIDWLNEKYGDYLLNKYWDHIAIVITNKDEFRTCAKEKLEDKYEKEINEIPEDEMCDFVRRLILEAKDDSGYALGITSVGFEQNDESMVLAFGITGYTQEGFELWWLDFFLNDSDVLKFVEENEDWIDCQKKFTNEEIINLLS